MRENITLTAKEQQQLQVIGRVDRGEVTAAQAAEVLGRSERQVRRILAAYRTEGAAAIIHGNRGRAPAHTIPAEMRQQILALVRTRYPDLNDTHLTEKLVECEGIQVSRSTVRRIRREAGLSSPRARRMSQYRQRRERMAQAGLLVQWDGSQHAWLGERGPRLTLMAAIDDATGEVVAAHFRAQEDAQGYLQLLQDLVTAHGVPVAIYHDRHGIFQLNTPPTMAEQLTGKRPLTQVGRALADLGITAIAARSPQAKGRVERLFGTLQDRLVAELRLAEATTLAEANQVLDVYRPQFNTRFGVPAADAASAFRPWDPGRDLTALCCFQYQRMVAHDNTVQLGDHRLQLLPGKQRLSYVRAQVDIYEHLDGRLVVSYQGEVVASQPAPAEAPVLRARAGRRAEPARPTTEIRNDTAREDLAVVVGGVDLWAGAAAAVHKSTPHRPAPDHPWRTRNKPEVTESPNS